VSGLELTTGSGSELGLESGLASRSAWESGVEVDIRVRAGIDPQYN